MREQSEPSLLILTWLDPIEQVASCLLPLQGITAMAGERLLGLCDTILMQTHRIKLVFGKWLFARPFFLETKVVINLHDCPYTWDRVV